MWNLESICPLTPNCPSRRFWPDVQISSVFSHPSCTFCGVIFLLNFLWEVSFMYVWFDQKGNNFWKNYASFCVVVFHRKSWRFWSKSVLEEKTIKIKHPKNLQKSLHLKYYIITYHNKFHPHIVNILFVIELQDNFLFYVSKFIEKD